MTAELITIVVPGDDPRQIQGSPHLDRLHSFGEVIVYTDRPETAAEKVRRAASATCLINSRGLVKWPGDVLRRLPRLKMISTCSIGTDSIDLATTRELGIVVCNVPGRTAPVVAEHALALLLAAAKRLAFQTAALKAGQWLRRENVYLRGKTLGVLGGGAIGAAMARLGQALGMNVLMWTFNPSPERAVALGVHFVGLEELLRTADAVSVHLRLSDESRGLLGARELSWLKPGAILVNTARGAIVDTAALVAALDSGHLGAAGLDAFDQEPLPPDHPLLHCEQVVLSPHLADQTPEGSELLCSGAVDNVIAFLEGRPINQVT